MANNRFNLRASKYTDSDYKRVHHGKNVRISRDGYTAKEEKPPFEGLAYSARPVRVNEKVCIRFAKISSRWRGIIVFGFTSHNPKTLSNVFPTRTFQDVTKKPGNWAKDLRIRFSEKNNVLYYYFNSAGEVYFGINGKDKGLLFSGVDTNNPLWALIDIYGDCTVNSADHHLRYQNHVSRKSSTTPGAPNQKRRSNLSPVKEGIVSRMESLSIDQALSQLRYQNPLVYLSLHRTKGRNIQFINDRGVVARSETEFSQGYVFTARPMPAGQTIVVQILDTEPAYPGSLAIGLTS